MSDSFCDPRDDHTLEASVQILRDTFEADPYARWLFPEDRSFRRGFSKLTRAFCKTARDDGAIDLHESQEGVAIWLRSGAKPGMMALAKAVLTEVSPSRWPPLLKLFLDVERRRPKVPHWYAVFCGVRTSTENNLKLRSAIMSRGLERVDREGLPSYLEATSHKNARLWGRLYGFHGLEPIQIDGVEVLFPMYRPAVN